MMLSLVGMAVEGLEEHCFHSPPLKAGGDYRSPKSLAGADLPAQSKREVRNPGSCCSLSKALLQLLS